MSFWYYFQIEDSKGNVGVGEREYLVAPSYGSIVMTALADNPAANDSRSQEKKPFDWMTDDQFTNLQILAIHYEWFQEMFDRMSKVSYFFVSSVTIFVPFFMFHFFFNSLSMQM